MSETAVVHVPLDVARDALACLEAVAADQREPARYREQYDRSANALRELLADE